MTERIAPTSDLGFKKILTERSNKDVLQGIINDFLDLSIPLEEITVTDPYDIKVFQEYLKRLSSGVEIGEKLRHTVQDVAADIKIADFGAEVQVKKDNYFFQRTLYYTLARFCSNYNRSGKMVYMYDGTPIRFSSLRPMYMLNILDHSYFTGDDDALRIFTLFDRNRNKAFKVEYLVIAYFELGKNQIETVNQRYWRVFFKTGDVPADAPGYIKKAAQAIERVNMTQEERDMYDQLQKAEDSYYSTLYTAQIEGEMIGEARGKVEGAKNVIELLENGFSLAEAKKMLNIQ